MPSTVSKDFVYMIQGLYSEGQTYSGSVLPMDVVPSEYKSVIGKVLNKAIESVHNARHCRVAVHINVEKRY